MKKLSSTHAGRRAILDSRCKTPKTNKNRPPGITVRCFASFKHPFRFLVKIYLQAAVSPFGSVYGRQTSRSSWAFCLTGLEHMHAFYCSIVRRYAPRLLGTGKFEPQSMRYDIGACTNSQYKSLSLCIIILKNRNGFKQQDVLIN